MTAYLYSTKLWRFGDNDQYVIGKTIAEAARKVDASINNIEYVGTLLITKADMHVIFDPPPPVPTPVDPAVKVATAGEAVDLSVDGQLDKTA